MKDPVRKKGNHLKKDISIMCLVANENTAGARKLLKKFGKPDAINHADLELKLSECYAEATDKKEFEKELATMHPHREFLMKYLGEPTAQPTEKSVNEALKREVLDDRKFGPLDENFHAACGCPSCQAARHSNACGCQSSFLGNEQGKTTTADVKTFGLVLGICAIFGLVILAKQK